MGRDYDKPSGETGYDQPGVNPYLNTPPTELAEKIKRVKDPKKKRLIQKALDAWRGTHGNPLAPGMTGGGGMPSGVGGVGMEDDEMTKDVPRLLRGMASKLEGFIVEPDHKLEGHKVLGPPGSAASGDDREWIATFFDGNAEAPGPYLSQFIDTLLEVQDIARSAGIKTGGWWPIKHPDNGKIDWDAKIEERGGLTNALPGQDPVAGLYNGDGPADLMDKNLDKVDLAYRASWGRPAKLAELAAVFNFCTGPMREPKKPKDATLNGWVDKAAHQLGVPMKAVANIPWDDGLEVLRQADVDFRNSGFEVGVVYDIDDKPEYSPEAHHAWEQSVRDVWAQFKDHEYVTRFMDDDKSLCARIRNAADVGTDTASIWAISPEQLHHLMEDGSYMSLGWDEWVSRWEEIETDLRMHGGAVFHTGRDGRFNVEIVPGSEDDYHNAFAIQGKGLLAPYNTPEYQAWREQQCT